MGCFKRKHPCGEDGEYVGREYQFEEKEKDFSDSNGKSEESPPEPEDKPGNGSEDGGTPALEAAKEESGK